MPVLELLELEQPLHLARQLRLARQSEAIDDDGDDPPSRPQGVRHLATHPVRFQYAAVEDAGRTYKQQVVGAIELLPDPIRPALSRGETGDIKEGAKAAILEKLAKQLRERTSFGTAVRDEDPVWGAGGSGFAPEFAKQPQSPSDRPSTNPTDLRVALFLALRFAVPPVPEPSARI